MLPPDEGPEPGYILCVLFAFVHLFGFARPCGVFFGFTLSSSMILLILTSFLV